MKEYNEKRSNLGLKICLVVLSILVIGLSGFIVYDKFISENNNQNKTEEKDKNNATPTPTNNPIVQVEEVNLQNDTVKEVLKKFIPEISIFGYGKYAVDSGRNTADLYYHSKDSQLAVNLSAKLKKIILGNTLDYYYVDHNKDLIDGYLLQKNFSKSELDNVYHKLFGSQATPLSDYSSDSCPSITSNGDASYTFHGNCDGGLGTPGYHTAIITQFYKAEKTTDELYLYELVGYPKYDNENNSQAIYSLDDDFTVYKDFDLTTKTSGTNKKLHDENIKFPYANHSYNLTKIKEELDSYKYTFKLEDGNYYFYNVEKMK